MGSKKIYLVIAVVAIVALASIATIMMSGVLADNSPQDERSFRNDKVIFSDKPVYVLGVSTQTSAITDRLNMSTSHVKVTTNLSDLSEFVTGRDILIIDGGWLDDGSISLRNLSNALRPVLVNETPVIIINRVADVVFCAIDDLGVGRTTVYHNDGQDGMTLYPTATAVQYDQSTGMLEVYSISSLNFGNEMESKITTLYNWGVDHLNS